MVGVGLTYKKRPFVYQPLRDPVPGLLGQSSLRCVPRSVVIRLQDMPWMLLNYSQSGDIIITYQWVVKAPFFMIFVHIWYFDGSCIESMG